MLKTLLATALLIFCYNTQAAAQGKPASKARARKAAPAANPAYNYATPPPAAEPVAPPEPPPTRFLYVTALYSSADAIKYKGSTNLLGVPTAFTATENTTGALGFAGGYMVREARHLGYSGELAYELPRTSSGVQGTIGNQGVHGTYDESPSNSVLTLAFNGNYSLNSKIYLYGGLNYPFANGNGSSLQGLPGYQLGGGYVFNRHLASELSYRILRLKGVIDGQGVNLQVDEATFSGMILAVHYLF